jgi:hypothetical protein
VGLRVLRDMICWGRSGFSVETNPLSAALANLYTWKGTYHATIARRWAIRSCEKWIVWISLGL